LRCPPFIQNLSGRWELDGNLFAVARNLLVNKSATEGMPLLVTAAVIFDGEKVLITRRPDDKRHPGFWEFPGGKLDPGESPEEALIREIREELGAAIIIDEIFDVVYYCYDWGPVLVLAYRCRLLDGALYNLGVAEHRWVCPEELRDFSMLPADRPILRRLNNLSARNKSRF
jgi:8-oxo-dGTP diphosphatase